MTIIAFYMFEQDGFNDPPSYLTPRPSPQRQPRKQTHLKDRLLLIAPARQQKKDKEHILIKFIPQKQSSGEKSIELLRINKKYKVQVPPLDQQRQTGVQNRVGNISKIIQMVSPKLDHKRRKTEGAHQSLNDKVNIHRECSNINYKYKKSLAEVKKRQKERQKFSSNRSHLVRQQARAQLQTAIDKQIQRESKQKNTAHDALSCVAEGLVNKSISHKGISALMQSQQLPNGQQKSKKNQQQQLIINHRSILSRLAQIYNTDYYSAEKTNNIIYKQQANFDQKH